MKKFTLLILLVFSLGVFAASVDLGAKGSLQLNPQANKDNSFVVGQTDVTFTAKNKDIAFNWILNLDAANVAFPAPDTKYAWVEGMLFGGKGQVGLINPIVASKMAPGFYATSAFFNVFNMAGSGVSYETGDWTVAYTGAAALLDNGKANDALLPANEAGQLGVAYNAGEFGKYAIIMNQDKDATPASIGYDLYVELCKEFGALKVATQIAWGLQQSGAQNQLVALYANYKLDATQSVYASYIDDLADANTDQALSLGYGYAVNDSVTAIVDYTNNIGIGSEDLTVGLNFVL